ncbi:hypothetical protein MOD54_06075 [Bacillus spizizenii]|nr:hypothetical protein [Bacillus spizizenii]MCY8109856.1 hypothetical protein [Bacillus spizizenii]MCY8306163.1 hypothetical protein [Bacillus spizizenii]MCY8658398.1 hypothetical protein [Bacillus spizizenii]MCY8686267.1 hypothetical protein [Bacillus spizizenii]
MRTFRLFIYVCNQTKYSIFLTVYLAALLMYYQIKNNIDLDQLSIFDFLSDLNGIMGLTNKNVMIFILIPIICLTVLLIMKQEETYNKIIKLPSRKSVWNQHVIISLVYIFLLTFTLVFGGYIIGGLIFGFDNKWIGNTGQITVLLNENKIPHPEHYLDKLSTFNILIIIFSTKFLCLSIVALITAIIKTIIKNSSLTLLCICIYSYIDAMYLNPSLFINKSIIDVNNWLNLRSVLINNIYFIILLFAVYLIGRELYSRKDYQN